MAFSWGDIQRLKYELGYNAVNVGAEAYVLNSYVAVFDAAIQPYLQDQGTTSTTTVTAQTSPTNTSLTLASNPQVTGGQTSIYGLCFQVGTKIVVDVGPNQETDVVIQAISGLSITVALQLAHGPTQYPVTVQSAEYLVRDILKRLDIINGQLKGFAPVVAGLAEGDNDAKFFASQRGKRGQRGVIDDLIEQRDWARKDLAGILGIQNLWELRGKYGGSSGLQYSPF